MIKYFTIEDLLKHYLQKKFHILESFGKSVFTDFFYFAKWIPATVPSATAVDT